MNPTDIPAYMAHVGVAARAVATVMAAASTAAKNRALRGLARALRESPQLLAQSNALDLATAREANRVIVIDHGRIIEAGAPADLIARGGRFAALLELEQAGWDWRAAL